MSGPLPCNPDFWESALTQREGEMAVCQQFNQQELWSIAIGQERLRCSRSVFLSLAFLHRVSQCAARLRRAPAYSTTQYPTSDPSNSFLEPPLPSLPTYTHRYTHYKHVTNTWTLAWQAWIKLSLFFEDIMFVFCISHVKLLCVWALCPGMRLINQITITEKYYNMPSYLCWSGFIQALLAPTLFTMTNFVPTTLWKNWWWGVFNTKKETAQI